MGRQVKVRVVTRSARPRVEEGADGSLRVYVSCAPERGKANQELVAAVAGHFLVPRASVEIVRGRTARDKILRIEE